MLFSQHVYLFNLYLSFQASIQTLLSQESLACLLPTMQVMCPSYMILEYFYSYLEL